MKQKQFGFTLIELLVVISIIGLYLYYNDFGSWPESASGGTQPSCLAPSSESCWQGTYTGLDSLVSSMSPYMSSFPKNNADSGTYAYDRYWYFSKAAAG